MPRGSSSKSSSNSLFSSKSSSKTPISHPASTYTAPTSLATQHTVKVEQPGFFSNMFQGFALGAGQSIAMNIFRSNPKVEVVHQPSTTTIGANTIQTQNIPFSKEYIQCMKESDNNSDACKQYLDTSN
jgi:hypothetical protein